MLGDLVWFVPFNAGSHAKPSRKVGLLSFQKRLPYQLSATFISNQVCDIAQWHLADIDRHGVVGSVANDPKRTWIAPGRPYAAPSMMTIVGMEGPFDEQLANERITAMSDTEHRTRRRPKKRCSLSKSLMKRWRLPRASGANKREPLHRPAPDPPISPNLSGPFQSRDGLRNRCVAISGPTERARVVRIKTIADKLVAFSYGRPLPKADIDCALARG